MLSGTPTAAGTATFTVNVTDTAGATLTQPYTLTVNPALSIAPTTLPEATAGTATSQTITVSGGTKPYTTFTVADFVAGGTGTDGGRPHDRRRRREPWCSPARRVRPGTASFTVERHRHRRRNPEPRPTR